MNKPQQQQSIDCSSLNNALYSLAAAAATASGNNEESALFINKTVPLIQCLIDRKAIASSVPVICVDTPSIDSRSEKTTGSNDIQREELPQTSDDNFLSFTSGSFQSEMDSEKIMTLGDQIEDLKRQLAEKDEILKSELASSSDAKIQLADERKKVENLQQDLTTAKNQISFFDSLVKRMTSNLSLSGGGRAFDSCPVEEDDESESLTEIEMQELVAAQEAYIAALEEAKKKQDEESLAAVATAGAILCQLLK